MTLFSLPIVKRDLLLAVAIGCFIGSWFLIYAAWPTPEPDLWTKSATVDLGDVYQQQQTTAKFEFVNYYLQDVEIVEVLKGCSCSDATLTKKNLKPREQTVLEVAWNTGRIRGRNGVNVNLVCKLQSGEEVLKMLRVEANVIPDIRYEPEHLVFDGTKPETQSLRLVPSRMAQFTIKKIECNHPAFKAALSGEYTVDITFDGTTPVFANGLEPQLIVQTDSPNEPELFVPLELRAPRPTQ